MKLYPLFLMLTLALSQENPLPAIPELSITQEEQTTTEPTAIMENLPKREGIKDMRNPFTPLITPKDSGQITNAPQLNLFTKAELTLPSTARKIKKITLEYQNLNGSITTLEKELDGDIDWHFPLILSQEIQPETPNIPKEESVILGGSFTITLSKNSILLNTDFPLIRDFTLASPTRLVLDFQATSNNALKDAYMPKIPTIPQIHLDTHLDFYRITLMLDGQYKYKLTKAGAYSIELY